MDIFHPEIHQRLQKYRKNVYNVCYQVVGRYKFICNWLRYPVLPRNKVFFYKSQVLNLKLLNQAKYILVALPRPHIKTIWGKSVKEFMSYDQPCKQTNKDYYFIKKLSWKPNFASKQSFIYKSQPIQLKTFKPS